MGKSTNKKSEDEKSESREIIIREDGSLSPEQYTMKQWMFMFEYMTNGFNGTKAAMEVYDTNGTDSASVIAASNMAKKHIREGINYILDRRVLSKMELLDLLSDQARGNWMELAEITEDGKLQIDLRKAQENGKLHMIKSIKQATEDIVDDYGNVVGERNYIDAELNDSTRAREMLAKWYQLYEDKVRMEGEIEHTVKVVKGVSMDDL